MNRSDRNRVWELLLEEPVASVSSMRILSDSAVIPVRRGTAVLTSTRFVYIGGSSPSRPPKTLQALNERIRVIFPRNNITEIIPVSGRSTAYILKYFDGSEKKVRLKAGNGGEDLINLLEQDLRNG